MPRCVPFVGPARLVLHGLSCDVLGLRRLGLRQTQGSSTNVHLRLVFSAPSTEYNFREQIPLVII